MIGVEYVLHFAREPFLFVIRKQLRTSPQKVDHLCTYNIINNAISLAPTLGDVLESRIMKSVYLVQHAFRDMERLSTFTTAAGYTWNYDTSRDPLPSVFAEDLQIEEARRTQTHHDHYLRPEDLNKRIADLERRGQSAYC
jgi:hypothetical protein